MRPTPLRSRRTSAPEATASEATASEATASEGGFTLIELIFTMGLLLLVVGSLLTVFLSVQRSTAFVQDRSQSLDEMRIVIDQMTKEIRQATWMSEASTASRLEMDTYLLGVKKRLVYEATGTTLTRNVDGGGAAVIQERLSNISIFTFTESVSDVQIVGLTLTVVPQLRPDTTLVLTSEVRLRNPGDVT